jgi:hypothetical protein
LMTGSAGFGVNPGVDLVWAIGLPFLGNKKAMIQRRLSVLGFSGFFMLVLHLNNLFEVGSGQGVGLQRWCFTGLVALSVINTVINKYSIEWKNEASLRVE